MNINFHLRALVGVGGAEWEGTAGQLSAGVTPLFQAALGLGHLVPAGPGAQFAPVTEGAGEPCSCRVT